MTLANALLPEFDQEVRNTRKLLERLPDDRLAWRPHAKSWTLGELASHIANLPRWGLITLQQDGFDLGAGERAEELSSRAAVVAAFEATTGAARAAIATQTDAAFMTPWTLRDGTRDVFTLPKAAVLRSFVLNHLIHHRGQLTVYLRLCDVPLPALYGPSADES